MQVKTMSETKLKFFIYCRKSSESEDRQALSIESQMSVLNDIAEKKGYTVVGVFQESKSAKKPGRSVFEEMIGRIDKGEANALLVWAPNRLSRNSVDAGRLIYALDTNTLVSIITPYQSFSNTPNDKFLLGILWSQAKLENDGKGEDVKRGLNTKVEMGWYPFRAVNGYLNTPDLEKGRKVVAKDPIRFPLVRRMWDMVLSENYTISEIYEIAIKEWGYTTPYGKKLSRSAIFELFRNPFYTGHFLYKGELKQGKHEPMITRAEYEKVQKILKRTDMPRPAKKSFQFSGLMKCPTCGFSICGDRKEKQYKRTGRSAEYSYYRCSHMNKTVICDQPAISEDDLYAQFETLFAQIDIDKGFLDWAKQYYSEVYAHEKQTKNTIDASIQIAITGVQKKLEGLTLMRANGEIDATEYTTIKSRLQSELDALMSRTAPNGQQDNWYTKSNRVFDIAYLALETFKTKPEERKPMIREINSNLFLDRGLVKPVLEKPYFLLKEMKKEEKVEKKQFELVKESYLTGQTLAFARANPLKYPQPDSNRRLTG